MDGLSAAASGIAVVSLAVQLVGSVRDIRQFLHSISDAPEELKRLIDLLKQLELILEQVGMIVQRQGRNGKPGEMGGVLTSVLRAVNICESKLTLLEGVIQTTKQLSTTSDRTSRTLGSLKLACKKRDVREIEQQLNDAVNSLSLAMMVNLTFVSSEGMRQLHCQISDMNLARDSIRHELVLLRNELSSKPTETSTETHAVIVGCANFQKLTRSRISRKHSIAFREYTTIFGKLLVRTVSKSATFVDGELRLASESYTMSSSSWAFMPSFLSRVFEYQSLNTYGFIQRALRIYPLISNDHPIWRMCSNGDLEGIQALFSTRQVSPFSIDADGLTILHRASYGFRLEICELLFDVGLTGQEVTVGGFTPWLGPLGYNFDLSVLRIRDIYSLFKSRSDYLDEPDFIGGLFSDPNFKVTLQEFNNLLPEVVSNVTIDTFDISPISTAVSMLHNSESELRYGWKVLIGRLLALGPNLHRPYGLGQGTVLDQILDIAESPFESQELGEEWLTTLEGLGRDVGEYLQTERLHQEAWEPVPKLTSHYGRDIAEDIRCRYIIWSETRPRISWDWYIDPEGLAFEVLYEFRHMGPTRHDPGKEYDYPEGMFNWPYFYPRWESCRFQSRQGITKEIRNSLPKVFEHRFERRWLKKIWKLRRAHGIGKSPKIPGAWID